MARSYDWQAIRVYYEAGHTMRQCKERFGFANGAWARAIERGAIVPRPRGGRLQGVTRSAVKLLVEEGLSQQQIAQRLGITQGMVSQHCRALGIPRNEACARRYDWDAVQRYHDMGHSARECMQRFGFTRKTWHQAKCRGAIVTRPAAAPIETYLVKGRRVSRTHLKGRLLAAGLKEPSCEECGIDIWRHRPIALELHHVNGDGDDNRLENLQLLCPNCHSQTPNYSAKNIGRRRLPPGARWRGNVRHKRLPLRGSAC